MDTDIQIDTDLNGDPADDADNKGTDSYTSGAPFVIKKFDTKKERTVRITLFDAAGKKLGSRDLKVLLTYSDTAVTTEKPPETKPPTGLTDKEKEGLATLKDLISNKAPEGDRVKLMQLLSQLQENWPDDREKTKTIIDFQMKVSELALKDDVKSEFLDILDSFLLTDSETKDDIGLATSVLQKLIPKSNSKYEEIFGKDDKSGLVGEILSHPTNLELNKTIGEKILGYIKEDKEIPDGDKLILKEQLRVIIYGGSKNIPSDQLAPAPAAPGTTLSGLLTNILTVFLWIIGIVVGAAILLFIFFKIMNKNGSLGFQDFIIERVFGKGKQSPPPANVPRPAPIVIPTPVVTPTAPIVAPTIETLPFSPRQNTDLLGSISRESPAISIENPRPVLTPVTPAIDPMTSLGVAPAQEVAADIPDWLKSTTDRLTSVPEAESVPEPVTEDIFANIPESQIPPSMGTPPESELPSWLVGSNVSEIEPVTVPLENSNVAEPMVPLPQEEANQTEDLDVELPVVNEPKALVLENEATPAIPMENESLEPIPEPVSAPVPEPANEELPDWLKNFAPVAPVSEPVPVGVAPSEEEDIFGDAEIEKTYGFPEPAPLAVNLPESTGTESEQKSEKPPKAKKPKVTTPMPEIQPTANVDDLPDWLK